MSDKPWSKNERNDFQEGMEAPHRRMKQRLAKVAGMFGLNNDATDSPITEDMRTQDDRSIAEMVNTAINPTVEKHPPSLAEMPLDERSKRLIYTIGNKTRVPEWDEEEKQNRLKSYTEGRNEELSKYRQENPLPENATEEQAQKWLQDYEQAKSLILKRQALEKLSNDQLEKRAKLLNGSN